MKNELKIMSQIQVPELKEGRSGVVFDYSKLKREEKKALQCEDIQELYSSTGSTASDRPKSFDRLP